MQLSKQQFKTKFYSEKSG